MKHKLNCNDFIRRVYTIKITDIAARNLATKEYSAKVLCEDIKNATGADIVSLISVKDFDIKE